MSRTFGWVQDSGSFNNLKRVIMAIIPESDINRRIREILIPKYVPERFDGNALIAAITGAACESVSYARLVGFGMSKQLTAEENIAMFGYSPAEARKIAEHGGRGNAACTGIAQIAVPAQINLPDGGKKPYQGQWQAECFVRWAVSLGFMDYDPGRDACRATDLGKRFAAAEGVAEKRIIEEALSAYPPAYRILELLRMQGHLTKFEIGRQLGFIGEAGFTSASQSMYVGGISTAATTEERNDIRANFEGSSDKYARMIARWLCHVGWIAQIDKEVTESYLGENYTAKIGQSYMITQKGLSRMNRIRGGSRHRRKAKRVFWNMLATAAPDADYLRNRRYYTLQAIKSSRKTINDIMAYLNMNGFDICEATIIDDLNNFTSIGLYIDVSEAGYLLKDEIICLDIPRDTPIVNTRADISIDKDYVREKLRNIDHRYLALIDLSYNSNSSKEFEIETMSLFTDELDYQGLHLGGPRKPDGIFYKDANGVIVDTKSYSLGFNLAVGQADEMIRYIEENKYRGELNANHWWDNFGENVESYSYLFVSSKFAGHFKDNIEYIKNRTGYDGGVITAVNLLLFAEKVKSGALGYADSFTTLKCGDEVVVSLE